jgi:hypothetical protein
VVNSGVWLASVNVYTVPTSATRYKSNWGQVPFTAAVVGICTFKIAETGNDAADPGMASIGALLLPTVDTEVIVNVFAAVGNAVG